MRARPVSPRRMRPSERGAGRCGVSWHRQTPGAPGGEGPRVLARQQARAVHARSATASKALRYTYTYLMFLHGDAPNAYLSRGARHRCPASAARAAPPAPRARCRRRPRTRTRGARAGCRNAAPARHTRPARLPGTWHQRGAQGERARERTEARRARARACGQPHPGQRPRCGDAFALSVHCRSHLLRRDTGSRRAPSASAPGCHTWADDRRRGAATSGRLPRQSVVAAGRRRQRGRICTHVVTHRVRSTCVSRAQARAAAATPASPTPLQPLRLRTSRRVQRAESASSSSSVTFRFQYSSRRRSGGPASAATAAFVTLAGAGGSRAARVRERCRQAARLAAGRGCVFCWQQGSGVTGLQRAAGRRAAWQHAAGGRRRGRRTSGSRSG